MKQRKKISLARELVRKNPGLSKSGVAREFGISRAALYRYPARQIHRDKALLENIIRVMEAHPHYGHRRIALVLGRSKNTILRNMRKYGLKVRQRRKRPKYPSGKGTSDIPNRIKNVSQISPDAAWAGDFTELSFHGFKIYLATVIDLFTREIVGWTLGFHHTAALVLEALSDARRRRGITPLVFHSDQGSEYDSVLFRAHLLADRILPSQSAKAHPWENGRQESFYRRFKEELGEIHMFKDVEEMLLAIHHQIHYYNHERIHSVLKMTPREFYLRAEIRRTTEQKCVYKLLSTPVS